MFRVSEYNPRTCMRFGPRILKLNSLFVSWSVSIDKTMFFLKLLDEMAVQTGDITDSPKFIVSEHISRGKRGTLEVYLKMFIMRN